MAKKKNIFVKILFILLFIILLPLIILEKIVKGIIFIIKKRRFLNKAFGAEEFLENAYIEKVDIMEGYEFEKFLKVLFLFKGFQVKETARTGDFGADLLLTKKGRVTAVQAKRYNANVGAKAIQEIYSAAVHYKADEMMVITNSNFTKQAYQMAREQNVELVARDDLIALINEVKQIILDSGAIKDDLSQSAETSFEEENRFRI